jgi:membrane protein DedA with SNARE-associated domain/rhodanese-related sulfurtransferase
MDLIAWLNQWGMAAVFAAVALETIGLPVPSPPILVAAGALAVTGAMRPEAVLLNALVATLLADYVWFVIGQRHGRRVLGTLCRLSLSPDTCVRRTDDLIVRHGAPLLLIARFIPGVSVIAVPAAAAMGLSFRRFLLYDGAGGLLWSGVYIGAGMIFSREVTQLLGTLDWIGGGALAILAAVFAIYVGAKFLHRRRLRRLHRLVRISPEELASLLAEDPRVLPRSIVLGERQAIDVFPDGERDRTIVTFCTCPSEASAALFAEQLIKAGYLRVRVLTGGSNAVEVLSAYGP